MTPEDTGRLFIKSKTVTKPISGPVHVCTLEDYSVIIYYKWNKTSIFFYIFTYSQSLPRNQTFIKIYESQVTIYTMGFTNILGTFTKTLVEVQYFQKYFRNYWTFTKNFVEVQSIFSTKILSPKYFWIFVEVQYDIFRILSPKNIYRSLPPIFVYLYFKDFTIMAPLHAAKVNVERGWYFD